MKRLVINEFEKIVAEDLTDISKIVYKALNEETLYPLLQSQSGFLGGGFAVSRVSASSVSVAAGTGFYYDSSEAGAYNSKYKMIKLASALTLNVGVAPWAAAPSNPNNRYDIIVVRPKEEVTTQLDRYVKDQVTQVISQETVDKISEMTYEIDVVEGVADPSPSVPATPAGWLKLCEVLVTGGTGIAAAGDVVDFRNILKPSVNAYQGETRYLSPSGNGTDTTLANAIAAVSGGGSIVIMEDITLSGNHVIPANVVLKGRSRDTKITFNAGGKITFSNDYGSLENLWLATSQANLPTLIDVSGSYFTAKDLLIDMPVAGTNTGLALGGLAPNIINVTALNAEQNGTNNSFTVTAAAVANAMIQDLGSRLEKVHAISSAATLKAADTGKTFLLNSSGGVFNVTLPTPRAGLKFSFVDSNGSLSTNAVTLVRAGSELIQGVAASYALESDWSSWDIFSDGTNWFVKKGA